MIIMTVYQASERQNQEINAQLQTRNEQVLQQQKEIKANTSFLQEHHAEVKTIQQQVDSETVTALKAQILVCT